MSDDPVLAAVQKFMDAVESRLSARETEIRGLLTQLETRAASIPTEGPPGKDGKDGKDGADGKNGVDGVNGKDGEKGERGTDGIATREELVEEIEKRFADLQVRTLADSFDGVYDQSKVYAKGRIAMWDGQPWLSMVETRAMPGVSSDWRLFAKKGRDGRDRTK